MGELNTVQAFAFDGRDVRVIMIENEPWWVAADVCAVLGIGDARQGVERLDESDRCQIPLGRNGQVAPVPAWMINESGLYDLIMRSDKPAARPFRRWVTKEVLPSLRKTGQYRVAPIDPLELLEAAVRQMREERANTTKAIERASHAEERLAEAEPLADSYLKYMDTRGLISVGTAAKIIGVGPARLFTFMRQRGVLMSGGERHNQPYQRHINCGRFDLKAGTRPDRNGNDVITYTTMITAKGFEYLSQLIKEYGRP